MNRSPSSSAQAAREAVASRLRELRLDAGLTGRELAARGQWHPAKTSRIENARTPPSDADIRVWCAACDAEDQAADIIAASRTAHSMWMEWRRKQRTGLRRLQESYASLFQETRLFRVYASTLVPGLLQTEGYATALLSAITGFRQIPDDVDDAVKARLARSRVLHEGDHRFALLVEESVLRYRIGDAETMAGQLGHLLSVGSLPSVSLGIIPFTADTRRVWPMETFHVYDDELVSVELLSARATVQQPSEVGLYVKAFAELARMAVYGSSARTLIVSAIEDLDRTAT
ncbi:helix-turn-helix transcriptional regulator [Streptomyces sp. UNOB3_S3]|uniref:helix-turn-helix domain-containing protein n=1 Tax=Streptomyces sp. UNOB3_S3 TaxID=2871682 RepID=UPI001E4EA654|nr:helix-turn-helix transcriptional regulator [Streptomyces sp. UNOB3_S3]MCC3778161.1 helix-turn-helix transcriptional regulator [Streptomyces sp. UNOB3_S3]